MEILGVVIGIIGLVIFFIFEFPSKLKGLLFAVSVSPREISVDKSDWVTKTSIDVKNNKPYPLYSLQLELIETNSGSSIDDISIEPQSHMVGNINMNAFVISKEDKKSNIRTKVVPLHKIDAQSSLPINISIPATQKLEKYKIRVANYKKTPTPIREQGKATFVNFDLQ